MNEYIISIGLWILIFIIIHLFQIRHLIILNDKIKKLEEGKEVKKQ